MFCRDFQKTRGSVHRTRCRALSPMCWHVCRHCDQGQGFRRVSPLCSHAFMLRLVAEPAFGVESRVYATLNLCPHILLS